MIVHHLIAPPIPKRISGRPYHSYRTVRTAPANHPVLRVTLCIIVLLPLFGSSSLLLFLSPSLVFFFCVLLSRVSLIPGHWRRFGSFTLSCYPLFLYLFVQVTLFIPPLSADRCLTSSSFSTRWSLSTRLISHSRSGSGLRPKCRLQALFEELRATVPSVEAGCRILGMVHRTSRDLSTRRPATLAVVPP